MRTLIILTCAVTLAVALGAFAVEAPPESISTAPLDNKDAGKQQTSIGSLVADAFRAAVRADVAFVAAGDLKRTDDPLPAGKVRSSDVAALLAYPDDRVLVMALDGRKIRQALEIAVSAYPRPSLAFLQVSGMKFAFDPTKPAGQRVTSVTIGNRSIADDQAYTVAMLSSLADGALGYWKIWSRRNVVDKAGAIDSSDAVDAYFRANARLNYGALDRISLREQ